MRVAAVRLSGLLLIMAVSQQSDFARPLATALNKLAFTLESENEARVIVAKRTEDELKQQVLPAHFKTTPRPLKGERVVMHGAKNFRISRLKLASWPEDNVDELAVPCLMLVVSGQADIVAGEYIMHCRPGDVVMVPPGIPKGNNLSYVLSGNLQRSSDVFWIYPGRLLGEGLECWITHSCNNRYEENLQRGAALIKNRSLAQLFAQLCDELGNHSKKNIIYYLLLSFILLLHRELDSGRGFMPDIRRLHLPVEQTSDFADFVKAYIESNLDSPLTIEGMARQLVMSPTSFKQRFRDVMGMTFHEYLTNSRAEFAAVLLHDTDLKVEKVAAKVGLKYPQFRKLIVKKYGCTPGVYRKKRNDVRL